MCGIAGIARRYPAGVGRDVLARMAEALHHRGPDAAGVMPGARVGLAHTRLSIVDIEGGAQPMENEDGQVVVTFNGEIYNHVELRSELAARGHDFRTRCDTEVLVHGWEEWGMGLMARLNGQFAFAIHDRRDESVLLVRDRFGVRPLFWAERDGDLFFASEVKALFATREVDAAPDLEGLDEIFTFWGARAPRTPFRGVQQIEPGGWLRWQRGSHRTGRYYALRFDDAVTEPGDAIERLDDIMRTGVAMRMRADVPVGGYLSGGLDSSITCALAARLTPHQLRSFSVTFEDPRFDESEFQQLVASAVHSRHTVQHVDSREIARVFPAVVWHAETPMVRTAPAPMYLLASSTKRHGISVVLTGEGADELFLGYDLFKETKLRALCLARPQSAACADLFDRLYPYLGPDRRGRDFWRRFFLGVGAPSDPLFSHLPRFALTSKIKEFYSDETRAALGGFDAMEELRQSLPAEFSGWSTLHRAAYLEMTTLLPSYLLSTQGDRMGMAHAVEGRFPFLDHRLFELAASLPTRSKLRGLREKHILRRWAEGVVPPIVQQRPKQPYRAPDVPSFFGAEPLPYVRELLAPDRMRAVGLFDVDAVQGLVRRCESGRATGFAENQALVAILSTQLWYDQFVGRPVALPTGAIPFARARDVRPALAAS